MITVQCAEPEKLVGLVAQWDHDQATAGIMGYMGMRVLADRQHAGRSMIMADFGVVVPQGNPNCTAAGSLASTGVRSDDPRRVR